MEYNHKQTIEALQCCSTINDNVKNCGECPLKDEHCTVELPKASLSLIKELTEKNSNLDDTVACLKVELETERRDTAKRIFEELEKYVEVALMNGHIETPILCIGHGVFVSLKKKFTEDTNGQDN